MRGLVALLTLTCACNQVFGVDRTGLVDAPTPIDAAVDAPPPTCPTDGSVPTFKNELVNVPARYCRYYSVSEATGEAAALCASDGIPTVGAGPLDGPLAAQVLDPPSNLSYVTSFVFTHEGHQILMSGFQDKPDGSSVHQTLEYARTATGWVLGKSYIIDGSGQFYGLSTPSVGPDRRALIFRWDDVAQAHVVDEMQQSAGTWTKRDSYTMVELGVTSPAEMMLSADGLRFVFVTYETTTTTTGGTGPAPDPSETAVPSEKLVYYTSRPTLGDRFATARPMASVPGSVDSPYMTENCGRIYFSALNSVWYLRQ